LKIQQFEVFLITAKVVWFPEENRPLLRYFVLKQARRRAPRRRSRGSGAVINSLRSGGVWGGAPLEKESFKS